VTVPGGGTGRWSPWARQVTGRVALLGCAYVGGGAVALAAVRYHGSPSYAIGPQDLRGSRECSVGALMARKRDVGDVAQAAAA